MASSTGLSVPPSTTTYLESEKKTIRYTHTKKKIALPVKKYSPA